MGGREDKVLIMNGAEDSWVICAVSLPREHLLDHLSVSVCHMNQEMCVLTSKREATGRWELVNEPQ